MASSQSTVRQAPLRKSASEPQLPSPKNSDQSHHIWRSEEKSNSADNAAHEPDKKLDDRRLDPPVLRDHLRYFTRTVLPIIFGILFVIAATTLLIYTFGLKKAVSPRFVRKIGILFATVIGLWCVLCVCLWFRGKIQAGVELENVNKARKKAQEKELKAKGVRPEPEEVVCPMRKRRIKAAVIKGGVSGWKWVKKQPKALEKKWKAYRQARLEKHQREYGIRPYDEENIPPEPAPVGGLLDAAECPGKRASTFGKLLPSIQNPRPTAPERTLWDKLFGRHKVPMVQRTKSALEREKQERIARMYRKRDYATFESSAQGFDVQDPRERPVLNMHKPSIDSKTFGAGRHHFLKNKPATTLTARPKPRNPAESTKVGNATTLVPQQAPGKVQAYQSGTRTNSPGDNFAQGQGNLDGHDSPLVVERTAAAGTSNLATQAEVHFEVDKRQSSTTSTPQPQPPHDGPSTGSNLPAPPSKISDLRCIPTLRRRPANSDLQVENPSVPPNTLNLAINTFHLPSDAETGLASILLVRGRREAAMFPQQALNSDQDLSKMSLAIAMPEQAHKPSRSHQVDTRHKPLALSKALSDIPEVPSPDRPRSYANSSIFLPDDPAHRERPLKRKSGRDDMRSRRMTFRPSRLRHEVAASSHGSLPLSNLAVYERQQNMSQASRLVEDPHRSSPKTFADNRPISCPAAISHSAPDPTLMIRPLNLPTRKAPFRILSDIIDEGGKSRESTLPVTAMLYRSPEVEDVSPRTSVDAAYGMGTEETEDEGQGGRNLVAPQLRLSKMDMERMAGKGGFEFKDGTWI